MTESDWSSEGSSVAPPKKGIPGWVWGCGGGCALVLLVGVVLAFFGFRYARKFVDQDANWARIDEVLPVVERPEGYFVIGMPMKIDGISMFILTDPGGQRQAILFHGAPGAGTEDTRRELFQADGDVNIGGPLEGYGRNDVTAGTVEVQGRDLRVVRYQAFSKDSKPKGLEGMMANAMDGANLIADLTPPGSEELLALIYSKQRTREPVSDEELREFLSAFRLPGPVITIPEVGASEEEGK